MCLLALMRTVLLMETLDQYLETLIPYHQFQLPNQERRLISLVILQTKDYCLGQRV